MLLFIDRKMIAYYNSKKVKEGNAFIALVGHNMDGHKYISDAINNGASVIFIENGLLVC